MIIQWFSLTYQLIWNKDQQITFKLSLLNNSWSVITFNSFSALLYLSNLHSKGAVSINLKKKWCGILQDIPFRTGPGPHPTPGTDWSHSVCGWLAFLGRQWARRPSALTGPDDIISTGSQWLGESLQWFRANGPDVSATWPVPGLRMLPLTGPVMQSRGSAVCCLRFSGTKLIPAHLEKATVIRHSLATFCASEYVVTHCTTI